MDSLVNDQADKKADKKAANIQKKSYPKFLLVWAGQLMSGLGNGMTAFALGVYVYRQTQSATNFAMVSLCLFIPSILLRPLGGVLADRFDRRFLIIGGDLGSAVAVLFLLMCTLSGNLSLWRIYLGVGINSIFTALQAPAYKASVTDLLTADQFAKAGGLVQLASSAQHLFSPVAAGFILSLASLTTVLLFDLSTFLIAVVAVLTIRRRCGAPRQDSNWSIPKDLREGWRAAPHTGEFYRWWCSFRLLPFLWAFCRPCSRQCCSLSLMQGPWVSFNRLVQPACCSAVFYWA